MAIATKTASEIEFFRAINIDDALNISLNRHPILKAAWHNTKAFDAAILQAGTLPNPYLSAEIEEFGGSGEFSGTGLMSSKIGISQEIPIAGQLSRRVNVAKAEKKIAEMEYIEQALTLRTEVKKRFLKVYILQEQLKLEEENLDLIRSLEKGVMKRVSAGEASPIDEVKVAVLVESANITMERTKRELEASKYALASTWAGESTDFTGVKSAYEENYSIPNEKELMEILYLNPSCKILDEKRLLASANLDLARSEAWMDIELGGGVQRFNETDDHAYFLEVNIPIPIFNRNRGKIDEAVHAHRKSQKEYEAGIIELKTSLIKLIKQLQSVQKAFQSMQNNVMPAAKLAYESVSKAYQVGEQDYIELIEAHRSYLMTKRENLDLYNELQSLIIELEGFSIEDVQEFYSTKRNKES